MNQYSADKKPGLWRIFPVQATRSTNLECLTIKVRQIRDVGGEENAWDAD